MPGYELSRFIELSQSDAEEYTCNICQDIFRNPVVTNCCLQTFCELCISEWLETNNTVPVPMIGNNWTKVSYVLQRL